MKFKKWGIYGSIPEVNPRKLDRGTPISDCKKRSLILGIGWGILVLWVGVFGVEPIAVSMHLVGVSFILCCLWGEGWGGGVSRIRV